MKYCPNTDCSYARVVKRAGEYAEGASTCSDCGAVLTDAPPTPAVDSRPRPSDANRRLVVTFAAALAALVLARLPVFGGPLPPTEATFLPGTTGDGRAPLLMLAAGMTPFITAFLLVELVAIALPPLRALRVGGKTKRSMLDRVAWGLGTLFLLVQLFTITRYAASKGAVPPPLLLWVQFGFAHLAMVGLALLVNRAGLGNGFALLMALGPLEALPESGRALVLRLRLGLIVPLDALVLGVALAGMGIVAVHLARKGRGRGASLPSAAPNPISSTAGWSVAVAALALPASLSLLLPQASWFELHLRSSTGLFWALFAFVAVGTASLIGVLSFRPRAIGAIWKRWVPGVDEIGVAAAARSLLPRALAISVGLTVGLPFLVTAFSTNSGLGSAGAVSLLVMVGACAVADVQDEWFAARRLGPLISVWEVQRTAEVEPIIHLLGRAGIEAHPRSFLLRATQQFFAPWIPVSILVPVERADEARALLSS